MPNDSTDNPTSLTLRGYAERNATIRRLAYSLDERQYYFKWPPIQQERALRGFAEQARKAGEELMELNRRLEELADKIHTIAEEK